MVKVLSSTLLLRRIKRLEQSFAVAEEEWIDLMMWNAGKGGIFGHSHYRLSRGSGKCVLEPCSDEEEIEIMRRHYEEDEGRPSGRGTAVSFSEYLEFFSYLGSEKLAAERRKVIEKMRDEV